MREIKQHEGWIETAAALPDNQVVVDTKIEDEKGVRNEQQLKRRNQLWFYPDGSMYVYYTPTHWKPLPTNHLNK